MKFVDSIKIRVASGDGGAGLVSFRSVRKLAKGGADGGDGGFGGNVYLRGRRDLNSLSRLYYNRLYAAGHGERGKPNGATGKNGADQVIQVPVGTVAIDRETGETLCEVLDEEDIMLAKGGKRGLGNLRYLSSTHQAPEESTPGGEGQLINIRLELKLIADVGFAGFPNAGKSTLLSTITAAKPKIADYPFTTLTPHLGVVDIDAELGGWGKSFIAADIPGLVEGAAEGKGLGHEFLKHLERTQVIVYVLDSFCVEGRSPKEAYERLSSELEEFSDKLSKKRKIVVLSKTDLAPPEFDWYTIENYFKDNGVDVLRVSSATRSGLRELKIGLWQMINQEKSKVEVSQNDIQRSADDDYETVVKAHDSDLGF